MTSSPFRLALLGLALGVLLALLLAPQTRWLVRLQVLTSLRLYHPFPNNSDQSYTLSLADDTRHIQAAIARRPDDFGLHYAAAVNGGDSAQAAANLRALEPRFPNRPALYANILRYASADLHWNRTEENALYDMPVHPKEFHPVPNDPKLLAAFDRDAAAGERLDPNNAFFPVMRAVGLFAAKRDAEALAAMERSERETEWREYVPEDVEARWRLHEAVFGDPGAFPRSVAAYSTLLPEFAKLRALARLLLAKTVAQEQAGHAEEGLKLREEVRHYGDLMRVQSTSVISSLVGIAIASIATSRPGGAPMPKDAPGLTREQNQQRRMDAYCAYVTRIGHPEAAARARAEHDAGWQVTTLVSVDQFPHLVYPIFRLAAWWLAGLSALANILWLLLLGGLAVALARVGRVREANPLPSGAAAGFWIALVPSLGLLALLLAPPQAPGPNNLADELLFPLAALILVPLAGFGIGAIIAPRLRRPIGFGIGAALVTLAVVAALGALVAWQAHGLGELWGGIQSLTASSNDDNDADSQAAHLGLIALSMALSLAIPFLLILVSAIGARIRRVPVSVGLVQGFRAAALPLACGLILLWGGLLLGTVRQERAVNAGLWHTVHDEGPYLAARAGQPWPGPVR